MANDAGGILMKIGCGTTLLVWVGLPVALVSVVAVMVFPPLIILPIGAFVVWLFRWAIRKDNRRKRARAERKYETLQKGMTLEEVRAIMGSEGETVEEQGELLIVHWFVQWYDGGIITVGIMATFSVGPGGPVLTEKHQTGELDELPPDS